MKNFFIRALNKRGYQVDTSALSKIGLANSWYTNKFIKGFHNAYTINGIKYNLEQMNFAKRICADDANLIEVININAQKNKKQNEYVIDILEKNNFYKMYRKQIEQLSALGTVGCYINIKNATIDADTNEIIELGDIGIQYCNCLNIVPLTVINDEITEVAFLNQKIVKGSNELYNMILFTLNENKQYDADIVYFDERGTEREELSERFNFGEVKPFAILRNAEENNLAMKGYGFPKLWNAIPNLKILDLSYTMWRRDLEKSDKIVVINQNLGVRGEDGKIKPPNKEMQKIFIQIGQEKLPQEGALYQEYNPTIRIQEVESSLELALSFLSMSFGYGTKKYTFENGRILTATEYIGDRQDLLQEVNKQRECNTKYIEDIINAIRWVTNNIGRTIKLNEQDDITVDFDDTYVENKQTVADNLRADALSFGIDSLTVKYFMKRYDISEEEAKLWLSEAPSKDDGTELEE